MRHTSFIVIQNALLVSRMGVRNNANDSACSIPTDIEMLVSKKPFLDFLTASQYLMIGLIRCLFGLTVFQRKSCSHRCRLSLELIAVFGKVWPGEMSVHCTEDGTLLEKSGSAETRNKLVDLPKSLQIWRVFISSVLSKCHERPSLLLFILDLSRGKKYSFEKQLMRIISTQNHDSNISARSISPFLGLYGNHDPCQVLPQDRIIRACLPGRWLN